MNIHPFKVETEFQSYHRHVALVLFASVKKSFIYHIITICVSNKYIPQMPHWYHISKSVHVQIWDKYINEYASWAHCNQQCDQEHWDTYTSYYWHVHLNNMSATLHIYVPLPCCCGEHIKHTSAYTTQKNGKCNFYLTCYWHICQQQICPPNVKYAHITQHALLGKICQYIYHIRSHLSAKNHFISVSFTITKTTTTLTIMERCQCVTA